VTPVSPIADGDIEHTEFSPTLGVDLSKMMRRPSGLYVQDLSVGTGNVAAQTRTAVVNYAGYLPNGKRFDTGEITITIGAGKVIRAWDEGVLGMRVGGRRRLVTPPHLAYGARGAPPEIPPNAVLVFDMELVQVY
jgi:FKBP-type peptidyl-prolyl cis-trans isomerase